MDRSEADEISYKFESLLKFIIIQRLQVYFGIANGANEVMKEI